MSKRAHHTLGLHFGSGHSRIGRDIAKTLKESAELKLTIYACQFRSVGYTPLWGIYTDIYGNIGLNRGQNF